MKNIRKMKKSLILLMSVLFIPMVLSACSSKPTVKADETAKILFNFYIKGDQSELSKIKIPENVIKDTAALQKKTVKASLKSSFEGNSLKITDAQVEQIYQARTEALKKSSVTTETVSEDDTTATIKLKATYFDEVKLNQKSATDAIKEVQKLNISNRQKLATKLTTVYIANLVNGYKNVKPSKATKEKTFKFTIRENIWLPNSMTEFGVGIATLATGV